VFWGSFGCFGVNRRAPFTSFPHRKDRTTGPGGEIIAYYESTITINRRIELERDDIELIWLEVIIANHKRLLECIYRPDSNVDYWNKLDDTLTRATDTSMDVVLTGALISIC